jgi:lipid-A-disaccharide synthase-like uncharacterized protein
MSFVLNNFVSAERGLFTVRFSFQLIMYDTEERLRLNVLFWRRYNAVLIIGGAYTVIY